MTDKILVTCPACRGAKKVMKLGGMHGDCNTCNAVGKVDSSSIKAAVIPAVVESAKDVAQRVAQAIPWTANDATPVPAAPIPAPAQQPQPIEDTLRIERKKAVFKHKSKG